MATGADLVARAKTRLDWNYVVDEHRLIGDTHTTDCSGFVYLAAKDCGLTIPTVSWTQARYCHEAGLDGIPIGDALDIAGALLFKGDRMGFDGFGAGGHVAISMGDGVNVIEAEGSARDVLIDPALGEGHPWTNAARLPGLDYGSGPAVHPTGTVSLDDDEGTNMIVQPGKKADPEVTGRLCTARLNVGAGAVDLFNGAAIAFDQPTSTKHLRRWKIGASQKNGLNPHVNGVPLGMAALPDGSGIVVTMSDFGTFIGKWS